MKIGISGYGFVGKAVDAAFHAPYFETAIYDLNNERYRDFNVLIDCDVVFICVPTPNFRYDAQDITAIADNLEGLNREKLLEKPSGKQYEGIVVIKSTTTPALMKWICNTYNKLRIVGNPEFLNQATANHDFAHPRVNVLGGDPKDVEFVENLFIRAAIRCPTIKFNTAAEAMFVKYLVNNFFAVKNAYFNEMHHLAGKLGFDWRKAVLAALQDGRIHPEHTRVPGPDGKCGFGGKCLPKDAQAMASESDIAMLHTALIVNDIYRKEEK